MPVGVGLALHGGTHFRRSRESMPRGRRQLRSTLTNSSDWWRLNLSVRFLTIFLCGSGWGAMEYLATTGPRQKQHKNESQTRAASGLGWSLRRRATDAAHGRRRRRRGRMPARRHTNAWCRSVPSLDAHTVSYVLLNPSGSLVRIAYAPESARLRRALYGRAVGAVGSVTFDDSGNARGGPSSNAGAPPLSSRPAAVWP